MGVKKWLNFEEAKNVDEYEREPVPKSSVKSFKEFVSLVAGEHIAGTEFVIGPLFVLHGVSAIDVFVGLLIGNILATLSWTLICAPAAVKTRLTIFYQLEKICGFGLVSIYNFINGLLFAVAAAAMIGVSASAIGILFGVKGPGLTSLYPESFEWVMIIVAVGAVIAIVATFGFEIVAKFSSLFAPWMPFVFLAAGLAVLPQLGVTSFGNFWQVANESIWTGTPQEGATQYTLIHIIIFSWLCNNAMHIGLADMSIYRYAKKASYGLASAFGMFIGHFMAWIASGILCALALKQGNTNPSPGEIAYLGAGVAGLICVVIAGWTTANPTIYRAGLAVQGLMPSTKRWKITVIVGIASTTLACFPAIVSKLDQFLGWYALVAAPVGAVVMVDIFLFPKIKMVSNLAEVIKSPFNLSVFFTWAIAVGVSYGIYVYLDLDFAFFVALPGWLIGGVLYVIFGYIQQKLLSEKLKSLGI
ncbi:hypothetical protein N7E81_08000 [Reichenbachiella carrageenanivorans]|uniref:Purine-cytosine permease n=1 Tax=Reichenbachiella carrageenanivorans TaxID=2979869 RepID=A0ABY6D4G1_9BACT|nr:hypothetical protein [Reichenbachiella carrageenanivorans]UXX81040.1 hypothetical protein N7E81_08000 [Reichenbachiella carrageenanivorans]